MTRKLQERGAIGVAGPTLLMLALLLAVPSSLAAQKSAVMKEASNEANAAASEPSQETTDAARGAFDRFLDSHPEIGSDVRSNPNTVSDPNYAHDHPALAAFLDAHPLVKADPRAFISSNENLRFEYGRNQTDMVFSYIIPFVVFVFMLFAILWVVRVVLENRRWNKSFKVHEEVHTKLLEKFASGQDLTAYMESDAGKRLLDWAPAALEGASSMPAAAGRVIASLQAGLVLALLGIGLFAARTQLAVVSPGHLSDGAEFLAVCGVLGMALGVGFVLSALISYGLSKHLGLIGAGKSSGASGSALTANR